MVVIPVVEIAHPDLDVVHECVSDLRIGVDYESGQVVDVVRRLG